ADTVPVIFYSDKGKVLRENVWDTNRLGGDTVTSDCFYTAFENAEYLLNIPMLKGHKRAGITMFAKNHFGSHTRPDASHLHNGLVDPIELDYNNSRRDYGMYRVQVDLMASKELGGKTLFYLMDALWPADQEISYPKKFTIPPFNTDWMSSVFASLDPVAIESVGYDFLRSEFTGARNIGDNAGTYAQKPAADDYLHQAADSSQWAEGIKYDPDNDSSYFSSLGVHEHWNNETDKQYSRNLGTGDGIELIKVMDYTDVEDIPSMPSAFYLSQNYPNPFNPSTKIRYSVPAGARVIIKVYDAVGKEIETIENSDRLAGTYVVSFNAKHLASGVYYYKITANNYSDTKKFVLLK
ncbi:MAG: T9SS type A sorting domain-containing protein, partial [Ignavibacteriaceae bacterium]